MTPGPGETRRVTGYRVYGACARRSGGPITIFSRSNRPGRRLAVQQQYTATTTAATAAVITTLGYLGKKTVKRLGYRKVLFSVFSDRPQINYYDSNTRRVDIVVLTNIYFSMEILFLFHVVHLETIMDVHFNGAYGIHIPDILFARTYNNGPLFCFKRLLVTSVGNS